MQDLIGRVAGRMRAGRGRGLAIAALDIGTEYAKALVVTATQAEDGSLGARVRGAGRRRQGLAHMQSGTVSDIDAVVANCAAALA